jgi:SAP domain
MENMASNRIFQDAIKTIDAAFPRAQVANTKVLMGPLELMQGMASQYPFLSVLVCGQLAAVQAERNAAAEFVRASQVLKEAECEGFLSLSKLAIVQLRTLLADRGASCAGPKADLVQRLVVLAASPASAADVLLQKVVEVDSAARVTYNQNISMEYLKRLAANAQLELLQGVADRYGSTSRRGEVSGRPLDVIDPYHCFHNIAKGLVFGGQGGPGSILNRAELLDAAKAVGCPVLISILSGCVDKHSHMASFFLLTHRGLVAELRRRNKEQAAVVLDVLGRAADAWTRPHLTEAIRTRDLQLSNVLVRRLFGRGLRDVQIIRSSQPVGGVLTSQWMDLMANNEARVELLRMLSAEESLSFKDTVLTTRTVESHFSQLYSNTGSGVKPTQWEIMGVASKLDALIRLMRDAEKGFTIKESKRKRKFLEGPDSGWNDGVDDGGAYDEDRRKRAKAYTTGRSSIRDHNSRAGGVCCFCVCGIRCMVAESCSVTPSFESTATWA